MYFSHSLVIPFYVVQNKQKLKSYKEFHKCIQITGTVKNKNQCLAPNGPQIVTIRTSKRLFFFVAINPSSVWYKHIQNCKTILSFIFFPLKMECVIQKKKKKTTK